MTKSLDFLSENCASREAKTDFLSFVVRELLTFEFVVSNRFPYWAINQKILPGPNRVNSAQQLTINAILLQNLPKFIPRNSVVCFFKIDKACKEIFGLLPRFLEDLLWSGDLVRGAATRTKTALTIFQF